MVKGRGGTELRSCDCRSHAFSSPPLHLYKWIIGLHFVSSVKHIISFSVNQSPWPLYSVWASCPWNSPSCSSDQVSYLSQPKAHLLPLTIIPKQEHSTFRFPHLSLTISTAAWHCWLSIWQTIGMSPTRSTCLKPTNISKTSTPCSFTYTHPWYLHFLVHIWNFKCTDWTIPCILCVYFMSSGRSFSPFSYQVLLCNFSWIHSHISSTLGHTLQPFRSYRTCFQFWNHIYFLPQVFLPLPRTITVSLLSSPPQPAAQTSSSSHRSQPQSTSLKGFPDYPSSELS